MTIVRHGIFFIVLLATGIWLSITGRPLDTLVFTIHKLVGVGILVYLIVTAYRANQLFHLNFSELAISVVTVVLLISTIVAGGVLSIETSVPAIIWLIHQIGPILVVLSAVLMLYMLHARTHKQQLNV